MDLVWHPLLLDAVAQGRSETAPDALRRVLRMNDWPLLIIALLLWAGLVLVLDAHKMRHDEDE